jgi:hypothetical protein
MNRAVQNSARCQSPRTNSQRFTGGEPAKPLRGTSGPANASIPAVSGTRSADSKEGEKMKSFTTRMMIAAAAITIAAGAASAQNLKAEIPFHFRVQNVTLPAGDYMVIKANFSGRAIFQLMNMDSGKSVLLSTTTQSGARAESAKADGLLTFECYEHRCALAGLWNGGDYVYHFQTPKPESDVQVRVATVVMRNSRGD